MMSALRNSFENASGSIVTSKFVGELEDLKMSPLSPQQIAWALSLGGLVRGLFVGLITLVVGIIFGWSASGIFLTIKHPIWMFFFLISGGISLGNLGVATAMLSKNLEQVSAFSTFILLPLIYLGGVFFSIDGLNPTWKIIAGFNPLLYLVNGLRYSILEISDFPLKSMAIASITFMIFSHIIAFFSVLYGSFKRW